MQCHKGVIPDLGQILGSAGILVTGGTSCVESLEPKTLRCLSSLLEQAIEDERLLILATGGGAEVSHFTRTAHLLRPMFDGIENSSYPRRPGSFNVN